MNTTNKYTKFPLPFGYGNGFCTKEIWRIWRIYSLNVYWFIDLLFILSRQYGHQDNIVEILYLVTVTTGTIDL